MDRKNLHLLLILLFFILHGPLCAGTSALTIAKVVHVSHRKMWRAAKNYCREHNSTLVVIRSEQEANKLVLFEGWIGLKRTAKGVDDWRWHESAEKPSFTAWDLGEPKQSSCVIKSHQKWSAKNCGQHHPFLCMDEKMIVVQELKTWEEALQHCRGLQDAPRTAHQYDLASLPEANTVLFDRDTIGTATTDEVWVGLRYLAGEWLWVSGEEVTSSYLPDCPDHQHCGAMDHENTQWKIMNCSEKRHFICSITQTTLQPHQRNDLVIPKS